MNNLKIEGIQYSTATCLKMHKKVLVAIPSGTNTVPEQRFLAYCCGLEANGKNKRVTLIQDNEENLEILSCTARNGDCPFFRR